MNGECYQSHGKTGYLCQCKAGWYGQRCKCGCVCVCGVTCVGEWRMPIIHTRIALFRSSIRKDLTACNMCQSVC